jgi:hypothetical protein
MSTCSDPLPDFTNFSYSIVTPPEPAKGRGWDKLKECERRLALYRWAERLNAPPKGTHILGEPPHKVFLDDCLSAFLLTLEAALQYTEDQFKKCGIELRDRKSNKISFSYWVRKQRAHDRYMRGLRTLRHFAAHVEIKPTRVGVTFIVPARSMAVIAGRPEVPEPPDAEGGIAHRWQLPHLTRADLETLDTPLLNFEAFRKYGKAVRDAKKSNSPILPKPPKNLKDLRAWNKIVFSHEAETILERGLRQAQAILLAAEKLL